MILSDKSAGLITIIINTSEEKADLEMSFFYMSFLHHFGKSSGIQIHISS